MGEQAVLLAARHRVIAEDTADPVTGESLDQNFGHFAGNAPLPGMVVPFGHLRKGVAVFEAKRRQGMIGAEIGPARDGSKSLLTQIAEQGRMGTVRHRRNGVVAGSVEMRRERARAGGTCSRRGLRRCLRWRWDRRLESRRGRRVRRNRRRRKRTDTHHDQNSRKQIRPKGTLWAYVTMH
ncbi:hypothetical protein [Saliniramus fredricksonii]|uniref:hypothetical protein n=1 Tax=Saliniramus fredricksonii TaxID=1653334 RepID=UPI001041CD22|nr:hypothetical protein [Saliniramus fredricksonii]